jgi:hypothetical protein
MKDLHSNIDIVAAFVPVLVLDATVPTAAEIDLQGFNSAEIEVSIGVKSADTGTVTFTVTHADDDGAGAAGDYAAVAAADMLGVTPTAGLILTVDLDGDAADETSIIKRFGYVGGKRFIKITVAEVGSNATGVIMGCNVIKGNPLDAPTS